MFVIGVYAHVLQAMSFKFQLIRNLRLYVLYPERLSSGIMLLLLLFFFFFRLGGRGHYYLGQVGTFVKKITNRNKTIHVSSSYSITLNVLC